METSQWYQAKPGHADHLVYLNHKAKELEKFLNHDKSMVIRGAAGRKVPLGGRAKIEDHVYFVETGGDMIVTHRGIITEVIESEKMTPEQSIQFIKDYEKALNLSKEQYERWASKRFLAVYKIEHIEAIEPFKYRRDRNMDDWIITESIDDIRL